MNVRLLSAVALTSTALVAASFVPDVAALDQRHGPYSVEVLVDGRPVPTFDHDGQTWVLGHHGDRYTVRIHNRSDRRVEAVVSVDGRDAIDGKPADPDKRGYLIDAYDDLTVDGWRLSNRHAAAFRFSSVADSYAALTGSGRDVGVIGVAVFPERRVRPRPRPPIAHSAPEAGSAPSYDDRADRAGEADDAGRRTAPTTAESKASSRHERERPGLGTAFGERVQSQVQYVSFVRESSHPVAVLGVRYNDRKGLIAMGIEVDYRRDEADLRSTADPFPRRDRGFAEPPPGWRSR